MAFHSCCFESCETKFICTLHFSATFQQPSDSFHNFTLSEDRCARLLVKKLGRGMPESVVREDLETLGFHVQGVTQLRSGRRDQDHIKDRPPTPTYLYQRREGLRCPGCAQSPNFAVYDCRWSRT